MATTRFVDHLLTGVHASRPAANAVPVGTLYACSTHGLVYQSDGVSTWATWATLGATETLPATIIDAKGDVIAGTANDTAARLAVGSDGQVLTADTASTPGVKWATPAAGAAGAVTLLSTTTLAVDGTFDVSSISGAYNDLILVAVLRGTTGGTDNPLLRFNNDTGANYRWERLSANTTTGSFLDSASATSHHCGQIPGSAATAGYFGVLQITVFGYASTVWQKGAIWEGHATVTSSSNQNYLTRGGGQWLSTAAITRVQIFGATAANLLTGSVLRIYGRL